MNHLQIIAPREPLRYMIITFLFKSWELHFYISPPSYAGDVTAMPPICRNHRICVCVSLSLSLALKINFRCRGFLRRSMSSTYYSTASYL